MQKIAKILGETRTSNATHIRKLKELKAARSKCSSTAEFSSAFFRTLIPLFGVQRRTASSERVVRFVSVFAGTNNDEFLEHMLKFLLLGAVAANKTARFRACQIISEASVLITLYFDFSFFIVKYDIKIPFASLIFLFHTPKHMKKNLIFNFLLPFRQFNFYRL